MKIIEDWNNYGLFYAFNEGVVEKLSREIVYKYLEETDWPSTEEIEIFKKNEKNHVYTKEISLINAMIKKYLKKLTSQKR